MCGARAPYVTATVISRALLISVDFFVPRGCPLRTPAAFAPAAVDERFAGGGTNDSPPLWL